MKKYFLYPFKDFFLYFFLAKKERKKKYFCAECKHNWVVLLFYLNVKDEKHQGIFNEQNENQ